VPEKHRDGLLSATNQILNGIPKGELMAVYHHWMKRLLRVIKNEGKDQTRQHKKFDHPPPAAQIFNGAVQVSRKVSESIVGVAIVSLKKADQYLANSVLLGRTKFYLW
jgi:hypothetical protein